MRRSARLMTVMAATLALAGLGVTQAAGSDYFEFDMDVDGQYAYDQGRQDDADSNFSATVRVYDDGEWSFGGSITNADPGTYTVAVGVAGTCNGNVELFDVAVANEPAVTAFFESATPTLDPNYDFVRVYKKGTACQTVWSTPVTQDTCSGTYTATTFDMIADGPDSDFQLDVGDVTITDDGAFMYVDVTTTDGWAFSAAHVHAGDSLEDFPLNKNDSPKVGQFFHNRSYDPWVTSDQFVFDLSTLGDAPLVAVHLDVWDTNSTGTVTFYSDGNLATYVTATNTANTVPFLAVDAWEAFGDPDDATESFWDASLVGHDFVLGDWVWESYRTVDPTTTQNVSFEHMFTVPGPPAGDGVVYVANDNTYSATMNGTSLGAQTDYSNWPNVGQYAFNPLVGENVLMVEAGNYGDASYNLDNNPAGLVYEGSVDYFDRTESAWIFGDQFNDGRDWAMYVTYTVGNCNSF
jgi:hypothetical protein